MLKKHPFELIKIKCEQVFKARYKIYDEDVIYDTMLSIALQYNKNGNRIQNFNAWLNGAIHHHFCSFVAQKEKEKLNLTDTTEIDFEDEAPDEFIETKRKEVYDEIVKLKSPVKEILEMKIYQDKDYTYISEFLNLKEATIRKHVSRAIQKISKNLTVRVTIYLFFILSYVERTL